MSRDDPNWLVETSAEGDVTYVVPQSAPLVFTATLSYQGININRLIEAARAVVTGWEEYDDPAEYERLLDKLREALS